MYATKPRLAYEIYERAKLFGQKPSDVALLDERVEEIGRFYFDRGIWAFGKHVTNRLDEAGQSNNPAIAQWQRAREWDRLMGVDVTDSTSGFQDPNADSLSAHGRVIGDAADSDEDDDILLGG